MVKNNLVMGKWEQGTQAISLRALSLRSTPLQPESKNKTKKLTKVLLFKCKNHMKQTNTELHLMFT